MKAVKITYDMKDVLHMLSRHFGAKVRLAGRELLDADGQLQIKIRGSKHCVDPYRIALIYGGIGGYWNNGKYVEPRVKFAGKGDRAKVHVWKKLLTKDELVAVLRRHNRGYGSKGNPKPLSAVVVYSPSASGWKRHLWNCPLAQRSYRTDSSQEVFLEVDPSAGLIRHPYCHMDCLDGHERLLREESGWAVDYCYVEGYAKTAKEAAK